MTTAPTNAPAADPTRSRGRAPALDVWRLAAAGVLLLTSGLLGWQGGAWGAGAALVTALLLPWLLRGRHPGAATGGDVALDPLLDMPRVSGGRVGAEVMVSQVVPVWGKQLVITREAAADGLSLVLDSFSQMAGALNDLANQIEHSQVTMAPGALDNALAADSPAQAALQALLAPSQRAFDQRDAAVAQLVHCSNAMQELRQLGRQARELGKHTRLVAFNASIEANRGGQGGGSQAVANETRMLASRMSEVGEQVERVVARLDRGLTPERLRGEISDTTPDELSQELALAARTALGALLGAMGGALRSSGEVKAAAQTLGSQLEESFVNFQFGDRLSQMLDIVSKDMQNFAHWVAANPYATQSDAADWLAALEASYTMEEQRSQHHGNVHIDRGSEVEFF
ncbi:MAG: methyl-accepting chemotaxis protein [Pseudomonadota bacterium]